MTKQPKEIVSTRRLAEKSVNIAHRFARELRPLVVEDLGLIPALHAFLKNFRRRTGIQVNLSAFAAVEQVNGDKRTMLYRLAQEALTNVARHAEATRVDVVFQKLDHAVYIKIKNTGNGFPGARALGVRKSKRLEMVGGNFTVSSAPGKDTTVQAQIPLDDDAGGTRPPRRHGNRGAHSRAANHHGGKLN